jgi:23S rRNA pseudouridine1911/1915/1917 synthase
LRITVKTDVWAIHAQFASRSEKLYRFSMAKKQTKAVSVPPVLNDLVEDEETFVATSGAAETVFHLNVDAADTGERLDRFLAASEPAKAASLSRTRLKALVEGGAVRLDGAVAADASVKLRAGQVIELSVPPPEDPVPQGEAIPLTIVYEDKHLIVLDKPAGLVVHPAPGHPSGTLVNALIAHCGAELSGIGGVKRPGIVHRLDKDTSGLLVVAKNDAAHQGLAALFADHGRTEPFTREYLAFVWGVPNRPSGTVEAPLGRHRTDREKMTVTADGREAVTHWELCGSFLGRNGEPVASLVRCALETGRTHQIRVHMAHLGHPLLGDGLYGSGFKTKAALLEDDARAALAALERQALHAAVLGFPHPVTGEELHFESALPPDLQALHDRLA